MLENIEDTVEVVPLPDVIQSSLTHTIKDTSKVNAFQECPRRYFYEYILGWRVDKPNLHLEFGTAFHLALEHLMKNHCDRGMNNPAVVDEAFQLFLEYYRLHFPSSDDVANSPKDPGTCLAAIVAYAEKYSVIDRDLEVLYTEVAGSVPVSERHIIHFKMDSIVRDKEGIKSIDHKTTGRETSNLGDEYILGLQPGTYSHTLYSLYPPEEVYGMIMNYVVLRKKGPGFVRKRIRKGLEQMRMYIFMVNNLLDSIGFHHKALSLASPDDDLLTAFPLCTTSCTKWGSCTYLPLCENWSNPLARCDVPPAGFKIDHWNPREQEEKANFVYEDGKLTEREEDAGHTRREDKAETATGAVQERSGERQDARADTGGEGGWEDTYLKDGT